jgi:hypothetical protein
MLIFSVIDRIIDLDAAIPHRALDLGVPEQLDSSEVTGATEDQHRLRTATVCSKLRIKYGSERVRCTA